jgi:hypothetical protein
VADLFEPRLLADPQTDVVGREIHFPSRGQHLVQRGLGERLGSFV